MRVQALAIACVAWAWAMAAPGVVADEAQVFVVCTGWHALCSASQDCPVNGQRADCDCLRVNETHVVYTAEIQDPDARAATSAKCTRDHPCDVDEAPVCQVIRDGTYTVDGTPYQWVSTYSYRGWCSLLDVELRACDPSAPGYRGDSYWAICDAAPCTEIEDPADPNRPLRCQCRLADAPFVGANGSCTGDKGGIMSSFAVELWDFDRNTYRISMPGYDYVAAACAPLRSDPPPASGKVR
ncbi:hypothetical protein [Devosia sp.]|uniref:hypothetical protein n=1 Tax=Devosia sp. TaxID=1871048 RepID=UPI002EE018C4